MKKKNYLSLDLVPKLLICLSPFFCTWTIIQRYPNLPQHRYLLEHNFTLGLLPIYIVHINENNQRLVNSYDPNILYDEKGTQRYHEGNKIYFLLLHCKSLSSSEIKLWSKPLVTSQNQKHTAIQCWRMKNLLSLVRISTLKSYNGKKWNFPFIGVVSPPFYIVCPPENN